MFTFRRFTLLFFLLLFGLNMVNIFICDGSGGFLCTHAEWSYLVILLVYFGISFLMAFLPCSGFHHPVVCHGNTSERQVALTFDDGPHPVQTGPVLDLLARRNCTAAFFLAGKNIAGNEALVERMHREGHVIGNHGFSHSKWFDLFPAAKMRKELEWTNTLVGEITGMTPLLFRPPFGVINPMVSRALRRMNLTVVCWNIRSYDTVCRDHESTLRRIVRKLQPGSVILLHDHSSFTATHLEKLIDELEKQGFSIVPIDKLLKLKAYV